MHSPSKARFLVRRVSKSQRWWAHIKDVISSGYLESSIHRLVEVGGAGRGWVPGSN